MANEYTLRIDGVEVTDYENVVINGVKYPTKKYVPEWTEITIGSGDGSATLTLNITKDTSEETRIYKNDELILSTTTIGNSSVDTTLSIGDVLKFEGAEFSAPSGTWTVVTVIVADITIGKNFTKIPDYMFTDYKGSLATKPLYIPNHIISIGKKALVNYTGILIIPSSVISIESSAFSPGNSSNVAGKSAIIFNHTTDDTITLPTAGSSTGMLYRKNAYAMTIYHYGNETILNYDYASDNVTPTFVDLREAK